MINLFKKKSFEQICIKNVEIITQVNKNNDYKIFETEKEIICWTNENFTYFSKMKYAEVVKNEINIRKAVYRYTGNCHIDVNNELRGVSDRQSSNQTKEIIKFIDEAMIKNKTPENIIVYRTDDYKGILYKNNNKRIKKGSILKELAFLSTTLLKNNKINWAENPDINERVLFIIEVPTGTKYISLANISSSNGEYELLLDRNLSLKVLDIVYKRCHNYIIYCRVINK